MAEAGSIADVAGDIAVGVLFAANAFKSLDLARKYYDLYKEQRDFYYATFQNGVEGPLSLEVAAIPIRTANYTARLAELYDIGFGILAGSAASVPVWLERHRAMYADVPVATIDQEIYSDTSRIVSDWSNYLFRYEEHIVDTENDIRWRKRMMLHNIGIKQGTAVAAALDQSLGMFQEQLNGLSDQLATYGNGIAKYAGYRKGTADTADSFQSAQPRILSSLPDNYTYRGGEKVLS